MPQQALAGAQRRVVILGGGFGGAYAAQTLSKHLPEEGWDITLIDRNNFLLFYPLLVEAGVGNLEPRHVVVPIRKFLKRGEFKMGEVTGVDLERQVVRYQVVGDSEQESVHYDHLVFALGSVTRMPPVPGLREHGFELKSLADSVELRDRGIRLLELANTVEDRETRKAILRVVIVGSNFTGIELAGEYQDFLTDAAKSYNHIDPREIEVYVVEYANRILPALDEDLASFARSHLERRGLKILTNTTVTSVCPHSATLSTGTVLPAYTTVWCAGIAPNPLLSHIAGLPQDEKGYIECEKILRVRGYENVWAVGDSAAVRDKEGRPYAATAQNASRQGVVAAKNVLASIKGNDLEPFDYSGVGSLAALGCRTAVAKVFGIKLAGFPAWFLYRTVYVMKMPSWSRRIRIVLDWTVDLFFKRDIVQLGVRRPGHGSAIERQQMPRAEGGGLVVEVPPQELSLGSRPRSKGATSDSRNLR